MNLNFSAVMDWVKTNLFIVIFSLIIIAAPIGMWFVAGSMNAGVQEEVKKRAAQYPMLVKLESGSIDIPGQAPIKGVINDRFLEGYGQYAETLGKDADLVQKAAVEHNRDHHELVMTGVLPSMPPNQREVLPGKFWEAINSAYGTLMANVGAGSPPSLESLREDIERVRTQFITQTLQKGDINAPLNDQDSKALAEKLTSVRLSQYAMAAEKTSLYVTLNELETPRDVDWRKSSMTDLYNWQWMFWVHEDVLGALHDANKDDQSVGRAPVKRVLSLQVFGLPGSSGPANNAPTGPGRLSSANSSGGRGSEGVSGPRAPAAGGDGDSGPAAPTGGAANPKAPVPLDYSASFTGRKTNPLYDVVGVDLTIVAETARLPKVIDALARRNFITVTSLNLTPADPFEAAKEGYVYGGAAVSTVTMRLETIWLREWTSKLMPDDVKKALGILVPAAPGAPTPPPADG